MIVKSNEDMAFLAIEFCCFPQVNPRQYAILKSALIQGRACIDIKILEVRK